jgi:hypothetical protein
MITLDGAAPMIEVGSLNGFAVGALVSGACALAITSPGRMRKRRAARGGGTPPTDASSGWLCEHVMAHEYRMAAEERVATGPVLSGERRIPGAGAPDVTGKPGRPGGAADERLARPEELGTRPADALADGRGSRAMGYRSRHRLGDPVPARPAPRGPQDNALPGGASPDRRAGDGAPRNGKRPAFPDSAFPDSAFPESGLPGIASPNGARRDATFPDGSFWRQGSRRMPRHAAPAVGLAARMTGLLVTRALASEARC